MQKADQIKQNGNKKNFQKNIPSEDTNVKKNSIFA
jgi:hypothetical protein